MKIMFISADYWKDVPSKIWDILNKILDLSIFSVYGLTHWTPSVVFIVYVPVLVMVQWLVQESTCTYL